jgi:hypothetical protein
MSDAGPPPGEEKGQQAPKMSEEELLDTFKPSAFLHDPRKVPCFRDSLLWGGAAGAAGGMWALYRTSTCLCCCCFIWT